MRDAYLQGRDLYSVIASQSFNVPYEDCLEFYPEGTVIEFEGKKVTCGYKTHQNKDGKGRRTQAKSILLGLLYGRGAASIGEQIHKTPEEAQEILDKFFTAFPSVKTWIENSQKFCRENGYVEDVAGRRRRLPDIQLPKYTIRYKNKNVSSEFNPFLGCVGVVGEDKLIRSYREQLEKVKGNKQYAAIKSRAEADGIEILNNGGFISQAERQCVNARVQGSAATLTKCALISIYYDQRLRDIGAKLVNTVHDEILLEVPKENSERCEELLTENMVTSARVWVPIIPMKCDTYNVDAWYMDEYQVVIESEYKKLVESGMSDEDAEAKVVANHSELLPEQIAECIHQQDLHICY